MDTGDAERVFGLAGLQLVLDAYIYADLTACFNVRLIFKTYKFYQLLNSDDSDARQTLPKPTLS